MSQSSDMDKVDAMVDVLDLDATEARTTEDIFTGRSLPMPTGRIFGGQVLAQSVVAASRTVEEGRVVHSMHGYFLRPGDANRGLTLSVDRIHDGRSFSTRRAQAYQGGQPIFSMIASFQDAGPGLDHQETMPAGIPAPETLPDAFEAVRNLPDAAARAEFFTQHPIETRYPYGSVHLHPAESTDAHNVVWMRIRRPLPDDPWLHRATLAFMSDMTIQDAVLRAHGVSWLSPGLRVASLDHAMWWHRDARVDDWLLYVQDSPSARGGRGLSTARMFTRDGVLVATVAQEIMIRVPDPTDFA
ncbi:acyl-CoA thioesterase [Microbacterium gorillae]|uniref:acyl-CoA thioesterase n=1 Tax=Microbacterium gorillae TaxID=1231063 RepID=UPI000693AEA8|nr:acyl-CoA thioesterase II [Microbacterium gorillae]